MNTDPDKVLDSDNGIISLALQVYADFVKDMKGDDHLYDRAMELSYLFRDMNPEQKYEQTPI